MGEKKTNILITPNKESMADDDGIPSINDILGSVDDIQNEAIDFLQRIIAINSTLEVGEGNVQNVIYDHIQQILGSGFDITKHPVRLDDIRNIRGYSPVDWKYDDSQKFNVVTRSRCRPQNNSTDDDNNDAVFFCGHVDVVPATYSDGWTKDPYDAYFKNGRMYGRGSGDMKAGVVAMIYALVAIQRLGYMPGKGGVTICTVVEEECTGNGALASIIDNSGGCFCCPSDRRTSIVPLEIMNNTNNNDVAAAAAAAATKKGKDGRTAVIIPEPFPWIVTAQMGVLWFRATVTGKPCHVLSTSSGSNAIEGAYALYDALRTIEDRYNEPRGCAHPAFEGIDHPVNFNLGKIVGGNWASSVPSNCTFEVRVGFFPGVKIDDVKQDVETTLNTKAKELGLELEITYQGFHADGAVLLPEYVNGMAQNVLNSSGDSSSSSSLQRKFVETLRKCNEHATKESSSSSPLRDLHLKPVTCTTDARFYSSLFQDPSKVVVTCYGPEATNIHGVDESVCLESFRDVTATMALFMRDWCGLVKL